MRRFFELARRGDWSRLELVAEDLMYRPVVEIVESGERRGRQGLRRYVEDFESAWSDLTYEPTGIREQDDHVVVRVELRGRGKLSGIELSGRVFQVFTLREGVIVRLEDFIDRAQALSAAGMPD